MQEVASVKYERGNTYGIINGQKVGWFDPKRDEYSAKLRDLCGVNGTTSGTPS